MTEPESGWVDSLGLDQSAPGGREVGWTCTYLPVEILEAAGLGVRRIVPGPAQAGGDACLDPNFCPLIKASMGSAVSGEFSACGWPDLVDLDAIVIAVAHSRYRSMRAPDFLIRLRNPRP